MRGFFVVSQAAHAQGLAEEGSPRGGVTHEERVVARGVDAVSAQPHRVARDVVLLVSMDIEFLLRVAGELLGERLLRGRGA